MKDSKDDAKTKEAKLKLLEAQIQQVAAEIQQLQAAKAAKTSTATQVTADSTTDAARTPMSSGRLLEAVA
ncbi:MAG: FlxA-like family protein [Verrucomicrobia subdivision 3 bacterium]|nr:FlxA-like family protein [Limisphaerales bacterium]